MSIFLVIYLEFWFDWCDLYRISLKIMHNSTIILVLLLIKFSFWSRSRWGFYFWFQSSPGNFSFVPGPAKFKFLVPDQSRGTGDRSWSGTSLVGSVVYSLFSPTAYWIDKLNFYSYRMSQSILNALNLKLLIYFIKCTYVNWILWIYWN